jgi:pectinesterase
MENLPKEASISDVTQIVVAKNEIGDFTSIQEAIDSCSELLGPIKITILSGNYYENITLYQTNITLQGIGAVKVIGNRYALQKDEHQREIGTFLTATFFINGEHITLENMEIINQAGPGEEVGQAIAMYNEGNQVLFKNCTFRGFQDTVCLGPLPYIQKNGQPFKTPKIKTKYQENICHFNECLIEGTVDFIFGGGEALFQACEIKSLKRPQNKEGYITAASTSKEKKGFTFYGCYITSEDGVNNVYLGRPWRPYSKTAFIHCLIGSHIHEDRWNDWGNTLNRSTVTYKEEKNNYQLNTIKKISWIHLVE